MMPTCASFVRRQRRVLSSARVPAMVSSILHVRAEQNRRMINSSAQNVLQVLKFCDAADATSLLL